MGGYYSCALGVAPGSECVNWTPVNQLGITEQGRLSSSTYYVPLNCGWDYYPAILLVYKDGSRTEVKARALGPKIAGWNCP